MLQRRAGRCARCASHCRPNAGRREGHVALRAREVRSRDGQPLRQGGVVGPTTHVFKFAVCEKDHVARGAPLAAARETDVIDAVMRIGPLGSVIENNSTHTPRRPSERALAMAWEMRLVMHQGASRVPRRRPVRPSQPGWLSQRADPLGVRLGGAREESGDQGVAGGRKEAEGYLLAHPHDMHDMLLQGLLLLVQPSLLRHRS